MRNHFFATSYNKLLLIFLYRIYATDDMMNDAAQYFARYIHDTWYRHLMMEDQRISSPTNVVLVSFAF